MTSLTRQKAFLFVRTSLPGAARGAQQTFRGEATAWGVPLPLKLPVKVAVQPSGRGWDAVFLVDLDLAALPSGPRRPGQPDRRSGHAEGNALRARRGPAATVDAAGTLRPGTSDLVAGRELAGTFVRFAGARLSGLGLTETKGEARIAVFNPFRFDLALREHPVRALVRRDASVARGSRQGLLVRPGRENEIVLPLTVSNAAAIAAAGKAVAGGRKALGRPERASSS